MPFIRFLTFWILMLPLMVSAQEFDKKAFCASLKEAMTAFETSYDSLKGEYIGANSLGIQQWKPKKDLSGAVSATYEYSTYLSEEYHATYVMKANAPNDEAADAYKKIVNAIRFCYGMEFSLEEKVSTEHRGGTKVEQLQAEFTRMNEAGSSTGYQYPYISVSSTAYETGDAFEVLVELISQVQ